MQARIQHSVTAIGNFFTPENDSVGAEDIRGGSLRPFLSEDNPHGPMIVTALEKQCLK